MGVLRKVATGTMIFALTLASSRTTYGSWEPVLGTCTISPMGATTNTTTMTTMTTMTGNIIGKTNLTPMKSTLSTGTRTISGWMRTMATMTGNVIGKTTLTLMKSTFSTGKSTMHIWISTRMNTNFYNNAYWHSFYP